MPRKSFRIVGSKRPRLSGELPILLLEDGLEVFGLGKGSCPFELSDRSPHGRAVITISSDRIQRGQVRLFLQDPGRGRRDHSAKSLVVTRCVIAL
jgi:hypothetical protein